MIIDSLKLTNFRNHRDASFDFVNGINLITGLNGAGKTNLLEAVNLVATGKSFRAHYDQEMVYNPDIDAAEAQTDNVYNRDLTLKEFSRIVGLVRDNADKDILELIIVKSNPGTNLSQKTFKLNGSPKPMYETSKYFSTVLFCPQDLDIFNGSPALRRRFLDDILCKVDQKYKKEHAIYTKAIRQRNRILEKINKTGRGSDELIFWTEEIMKTGAYLQHKRLGLIQAVNILIGQIYSDISSHVTKIAIDYKINEINQSRLEKHREHEIYAKTTLIGPHRDDFDFLVNDFSISRYGSRGQQRTGVLALKICELRVVRDKINNSPVLLLDDIFSEFDDVHRRALRKIADGQQTIITSTHPDIAARNIINL